MATKRFWLSWYQPTDDYRPLTDPPHPQVLGWWCSGYDSTGQPIICACVEAVSEDDAKTYVGISWPEATSWRFIEERDAAWTPNDRFPLSDWMKERFHPAHQGTTKGEGDG